MAQKKFYAVARGRNPGIYLQWYGENGAEAQVSGFPKARFKGFSTLGEAEAFLKAFENTPASASEPKNKKGPVRGDRLALPETGSGDQESRPKRDPRPRQAKKPADIVLYTDGGCINNPGPGGWGVVLVEKGKRRELSGGFSRTTNNRMELTACIVGLRTIEPGRSVTLFTDSKYVADGITKGWAKRWRSKAWMRTPEQKALNADLWEALLALCETRDVDFVWVRGHAGNPGNERCDQLATAAARMRGLPSDKGYDK